MNTSPDALDVDETLCRHLHTAGDGRLRLELGRAVAQRRQPTGRYGSDILAGLLDLSLVK
jgi:hypothetical protein